MRETATGEILISFFLASSDMSLSTDLFAELALGSVVAATAEVSFFVCCHSVRACIVEMSVSVMVSMTSGGADSSDWNDVLVFFCWEVTDEDRQIATKLNRLREEMLVIYEKGRNLVDEMRSIRGIVVVEKATEFVSDTVRKDNAQVEQLHEIESQMEFRALDVQILNKRTKTKAKKTKQSTGMERARKTEAEGVPIFYEPTRAHLLGKTYLSLSTLTLSFASRTPDVSDTT
ncbi:hypothetical protein Tco_0869969 [Tanacetum coccineum]